MPPSHTPTVNYQEHFGIDNNTRRRRTANPFDQNNVTPVQGMLSLGGDAQDEHDSTTGTEDLSEGDDDGEDESEGDPAIEDLENLDEDIGLEDVAVEEIVTRIRTKTS
ncbi:Bcdoc1 [Botrytis cinerea B05.10]|uniref:Bcdoc1 n=1 Tax=Botryotinia fuckeliana (strain B05.10) TaxID=332648 RepID=A0A384JAX5_BOTFB|nr:Bcdoc1 [Botrytis cinerea B05.10]ATZ47703.1 Bcdoc1 [Botrytis cinerea B05.10]